MLATHLHSRDVLPIGQERVQIAGMFLWHIALHLLTQPDQISATSVGQVHVRGVTDDRFAAAAIPADQPSAGTWSLI